MAHVEHVNVVGFQVVERAGYDFAETLRPLLRLLALRSCFLSTAFPL